MGVEEPQGKVGIVEIQGGGRPRVHLEGEPFVVAPDEVEPREASSPVASTGASSRIRRSAQHRKHETADRAAVNEGAVPTHRVTVR
jgi:hypothetical protein